MLTPYITPGYSNDNAPNYMDSKRNFDHYTSLLSVMNQLRGFDRYMVLLLQIGVTLTKSRMPERDLI